MKIAFHVIVGFLFLVISSLLLLQNNFYEIMGEQNDQNKANIYFKNTTLENEVKNLQKKIQALDLNSQVVFINKEKSLSDFKKTFGEYSQNLLELNEIDDLIPYALEVTFSSEKNKIEVLDKIKSDLNIEEITELNQVYKKYYQITMFAKSFLWLFFTLSFLLCLIMTSLLVKNIIYQEAQKIELLSLFGKSYDETAYEYILEFFKYYLATVIGAFLILYSAYMLAKFKIEMNRELYFVSSRIVFLDVYQMFNLTMGFALAYFIGLYTVLSTSIQKTFRKL